MFLISVALICDAALGNMQEGALHKFGEDTITVVLYEYAMGFVLISVLMVFSGDLFSGIEFSLKVCPARFGFISPGGRSIYAGEASAHRNSKY